MKTEQQYKELTIQEFSKAAEIYESGHAGLYEMCKDDYPYIAGELVREEYRDLLDCGCGTGPMISLLHERNPHRNYTGIDLTPKMIEVARAKNLTGVRWVVGDCENLPFEDSSFDVVICSNSFHHYPNPQRFFHSVARVLRPGGRLILQDYTAPKGILWLMNHTEMPLANLTGHGDVAAYSLDEVRGFCETAALRVEKLERGRKFRLHLVARKPLENQPQGEAPAANTKMKSEDTAMKLELGDIQTTALIPLAVKANETTRPNPRIRDEMAVEIIRALNIDTKPYDKFMSHEGVVARTIMLDRQLRGIIEKAPDTVVVNIGAGFDNRFPRVDNGRILWFDLDLPDTIAARKKAFPERDRVTMIAGDALESAWCAEVLRALEGRTAKPVFIAEGLFMYLTMEQIKTLLEVLRDNFPGSYRHLTYLGLGLSAVAMVLGMLPYICIWLVLRDLIAVAPDWTQAAAITRYGWAAFVSAFAGIAVYFAALMCTHLAAFRTAANIRKAGMAHLMKAPLGFFDSNASGLLRNRLDGAASETETMLAHNLADIVGSLAMLLSMVVLMFVFDWRMGAACLMAAVVSIAAMAAMMGGKNARLMAEYQAAQDVMSKAGTEYVRGIPAVMVFQQTVYSFRAFQQAIEDYSAKAEHYQGDVCKVPQAVNLTATEGAFVFLVPVALFLAPVALQAGNLAGFVTDFAFFAVFSAIVSTALARVMFAASGMMLADTALARIEQVMSAPTLEVTENPQTPWDNSVVFEDVSFTYEGAELPALNHVSFRVEPGQTVALVGPSGGGKTTAASLIPRFWDVSSGSVRVGGVDVRQTDPHELMEQVAFVFQNAHLFKASILENVRAARPDASRESEPFCLWSLCSCCSPFSLTFSSIRPTTVWCTGR